MNCECIFLRYFDLAATKYSFFAQRPFYSSAFLSSLQDVPGSTEMDQSLYSEADGSSLQEEHVLSEEEPPRLETTKKLPKKATKKRSSVARQKLDESLEITQQMLMFVFELTYVQRHFWKEYKKTIPKKSPLAQEIVQRYLGPDTEVEWLEQPVGGALSREQTVTTLRALHDRGNADRAANLITHQVDDLPTIDFSNAVLSKSDEVTTVLCSEDNTPSIVNAAQSSGAQWVPIAQEDSSSTLEIFDQILWRVFLRPNSPLASLATAATSKLVGNWAVWLQKHVGEDAAYKAWKASTADPFVAAVQEEARQFDEFLVDFDSLSTSPETSHEEEVREEAQWAEQLKSVTIGIFDTSQKNDLLFKPTSLNCATQGTACAPIEEEESFESAASRNCQLQEPLPPPSCVRNTPFNLDVAAKPVDYYFGAPKARWTRAVRQRLRINPAVRKRHALRKLLGVTVDPDYTQRYCLPSILYMKKC